MESHALLKALLKRKIDFIGTVREMSELLDADIKVGHTYSFRSFWCNGKRVVCGLISGELVSKNRLDLGYMAYWLIVKTTNTSKEAPPIGKKCLVLNPAELL